MYAIGVSELPVDQERLHSELLQFECRRVVPENSPLAGRRVIRPQDLDGIPFVALGPDHMTDHRLVDPSTLHHDDGVG